MFTSNLVVWTPRFGTANMPPRPAVGHVSMILHKRPALKYTLVGKTGDTNKNAGLSPHTCSPSQEGLSRGAAPFARSGADWRPGPGRRARTMIRITHPRRCVPPMPILPAEPSVFPDALFAEDRAPEVAGRTWWVLHTRPRREKSLARALHDRGVPFYLPQVRRGSLVRGRVMHSFLPLFPGYLFLLADREEWMTALSTGHVARPLHVADQARLGDDLGRLHRLIASGLPVAHEDGLAPGMEVVIRSGPLEGLRGKILKAVSGRRFVIQVDFIQQGASVLFEDCRLEPVGD